MCYENGIEVTTVPGPTAFASAAVMSGQPCRRLAFEAFLPKDKKEHARVLEELQKETRTILIYEAPHHLKKTLQELRQALGDEREITVTREISKKFEEKMKTTLLGACQHYESEEPRGEYVLVIHGKSREEVLREEMSKWENLTLEEHMQHYLEQGIDRKTAMKNVAKDLGISKRDVYNQLLQ
jgi:16S rRNA (cytidine1402-2'-O)-methyltransferase